MSSERAGEALLLFAVDPAYPVVLAVLRRAGEPRSWSRPGVTIGRAPVLASWEKESRRVWVGLGRRGVAGAVWGGDPGREVLLPGLEAGGLEDGVAACRRVLSEGGGEECGVVLASREGAWAWEPREGGRILEPGVFRFPWDGVGPGEGDASLEVGEVQGEACRGLVEPCLEAARLWMVRQGRGEDGNPPAAGALVALGREEVPCGRFLFVPGAPGIRPFLDYSNLLKRLCGPSA